MSIDILRSKKPQVFDLYLSIYRPQVLLEARLTQNVPMGSRVIPISTVTPPSDVVNRRMFVGSAPGESDRGIVRVRSVTPTSITVAENGDVVWTSGSYLTIYDYIDVAPIYPRIIQNPNNEEETIFYKDYDIPYTNQNKILGAFPCAGHHRAAIIDPELGYVDLYWTADGTQHVANSSVSYSWVIGGASPATSTSKTPGWCRYTTPGHYVTKLTVTGANGSVDTTYRYVSIYNKQNLPISKWRLSGIRGSRASGGWVTDIEIMDWDLPYKLLGGELVIIYSDDYFGNEKTFIEFGATQPSDGVKFVGYVLKDSVRYDYKSHTYSFSVGTINEPMKFTENFVISLESVQTPSTWFQLADLRGSRAIYHYLKWHSTVLNVCDFRYEGNDFRIQFFDTEKTNLYDALNNFFSRTYVGQIVSNKKSMLWAETLPEASVTPTSYRDTAFDLQKTDWIGSPTIDRRLYKETAFIDVGAIKFDGPTVLESIPLLSGAPSASPASFGKLTSRTGLAIDSQDGLNRLAGNLFAKQNSEISLLSLTFNGYSALDISPIQYVYVSIPKEDSGLFSPISGTFMVENIERAFQSQMFLDSLQLSPVIDGIPGETLEVPIPPGEGFNPRPTIPPSPIVPPLPVPVGEDIIILLHVRDYGLWWTDEYDESNPRWWSMNAGLTGSQLNYKSVEIGLDGFVWALNNDELLGGYLKTNLSPILSRFDFTGTYGERAEFFGGMPDPYNANRYILHVGDSWPPHSSHLYLVDNVSKSVQQKVGLPSPVFSSFSSISYGNRKFTITKIAGTLSQINAVTVNNTLSSVVSTSDTIRVNMNRGWHRRVSDTDIIYTGAEISLSASNPSSGTWNAFSHSGTTLEYYQGIHSSPDGQYFMGFIGVSDTGFLDSSAQLLRSSDMGTIWGQVSALTGTFANIIQNGPVENAGDRDTWIIGTRGLLSTSTPGYILITDDFGETWYDITGNLRDFVEENFIPKQIRIFRYTKERGGGA